MIKVEIIESLVDEIKKKFNKPEANNIIDLMYTVQNNPEKGKSLGNVGGFIIKELKYKNFRFYFITDGFKLKFISEKDLTETLIRFVRMSDKKHQQQTIEEIKLVLRTIGPEGFE